MYTLPFFGYDLVLYTNTSMYTCRKGVTPLGNISSYRNVLPGRTYNRVSFYQYYTYARGMLHTAQCGKPCAYHPDKMGMHVHVFSCITTSIILGLAYMRCV